jgi:hypothetical protein
MIEAGKNGRPICSGCCRPERPDYDRLLERRFEFVPPWGIAVVSVYPLRIRTGDRNPEYTGLPIHRKSLAALSNFGSRLPFSRGLNQRLYRIWLD